MRQRSTRRWARSGNSSARGEHRVSLAELLIAACAQQHGADVLHVDRHYDVLADVLAFTPVRAA